MCDFIDKVDLTHFLWILDCFHFFILIFIPSFQFDIKRAADKRVWNLNQPSRANATQQGGCLPWQKLWMSYSLPLGDC